MISRTSRRPPPSRFTLLGLRVKSSAALSFTFRDPGLEGVGGPTASAAGAGLGISSHSSPVIFNDLRKKGQRSVNISKDSMASDMDIGMGEDLMTALATSVVGNALLLRCVGVAVDDPGVGPENIL